jgi:hypothetical protein
MNVLKPHSSVGTSTLVLVSPDDMSAEKVLLWRLFCQFLYAEKVRD